jgi:23S rRNA pseudouridine1911/1915/1917 synthase
LVAENRVSINGRSPSKSDRVEAGALLEATIPAPRTAEVIAEPVDGMRIVFEDDDIIVVDKPFGVAAHPGVGWDGPTVVGHLAGIGVRISTSGAPERQGIVQRLDVGTSGLMTVAKSESAYSVLKQAFRDRVVDKTYHALAQGHPDPHTGTIDAPIARHPKHDFKFTVRSDGRASVTHYATLEAHRYASLLTIKLETGRTHQIRVHLSALHHPCVGDPLYGSDPNLAAKLGLERQWLHAVHLGFDHPRTGERVDFESPYPDDLQRALDAIRSWD